MRRKSSRRFRWGIYLFPSHTQTLSPPLFSGGPTMLNCLLTILALTGLGSATAGIEYRPACEAVEVAISHASRVYYPGENDCEQPSR